MLGERKKKTGSWEIWRSGAWAEERRQTAITGGGVLVQDQYVGPPKTRQLEKMIKFKTLWLAEIIVEPTQMDLGRERMHSGKQDQNSNVGYPAIGLASPLLHSE